MSKGIVVPRVFERLDIEPARELVQPPIRAAVSQKWETRDEIIRIVARIRPQLSRNDRVLLFAGVTQAGGASDLAFETALALSKLEGQPVLLIDAAVASPGLHARVGTQASPGLAEVIGAQCSLTDAVQPVNGGQLLLLPAGRTSIDPVPLFSSPRFSELMQLLRGQYRFIVMSAPPVLTDVSASLLNPVVDGVVLAVAAGAQHRGELLAAYSELRSIKAKVLGAVLCETDKPLPGGSRQN